MPPPSASERVPPPAPPAPPSPHHRIPLHRAPGAVGHPAQIQAGLEPATCPPTQAPSCPAPYRSAAPTRATGLPSAPPPFHALSLPTANYLPGPASRPILDGARPSLYPCGAPPTPWKTMPATPPQDRRSVPLVRSGPPSLGLRPVLPLLYHRPAPVALCWRSGVSSPIAAAGAAVSRRRDPGAPCARGAGRATLAPASIADLLHGFSARYPFPRSCPSCVCLTPVPLRCPKWVVPRCLCPPRLMPEEISKMRRRTPPCASSFPVVFLPFHPLPLPLDCLPRIG